MQELNFNSINLTAEKPGTKASTSSTPELYTAPTLNKLVLNSLATEKMGVDKGDTVTIFVNNDATDVDQMFFITKGVEGMDAKLNSNAAEGRTLSFSYSGVWSKMLQASPDAQNINAEALERMGLMVSRTSDTSGRVSYSANRKVTFELGDGQEHEDMIIYPLINHRISDYTPRNLSGEVTEEDEE